MIVPRELIPFTTNDVSALAKSLRAQLAARSTSPTHVEMLNMLARAAGHRNFQHLRAGASSRIVAESDPTKARARTDEAAVIRAARYFDAEGHLASWPARTSLQNLCLWAIWSRLPRGEVFDEPSINALLGTLHQFGDHAIIRRTMCDLGLMRRTTDGREYRRVEQAPPAEAIALIEYLGRREVNPHPRRAAHAKGTIPSTQTPTT
ncbi:MAG: DUF2087 domain-containing protein [Sphingomonadales bacterium]|nr:DUF2087 domain-containing protein [Sphingomonadales bacterium]